MAREVIAANHRAGQGAVANKKPEIFKTKARPIRDADTNHVGTSKPMRIQGFKMDAHTLDKAQIIYIPEKI